MLAKLKLRPGVVKDETVTASEGTWTDTDKVRFRLGGLENIGGWESAISTSFNGVCRGLHAWSDLKGSPQLGIGTNTKLYAFSGGGLYDITPTRAWVTLTNPFSTTISTATVTVSHTAHGASIGDAVRFTGASAVGGLTITGEYTVTSVTDSDHYVITAAGTATSTAGPGGGTVIAQYLLPVGLQNGTGGLGYGTGTYGTGTYGSPSLSSFEPRTWAITNWGQNGIFNYPGGAIYEWVPTVSNAEQCPDTNFSIPGDWTLGAGWSIAANTATHVAANATDISVTVPLTVGTTPADSGYYRLVFTCTRSAGTLQPKNGTTTIGAAISATGTYTLDFTATSTTLTFSADAAFAGTITAVSVKTNSQVRQIANAPTQVNYAFVMPTQETLVTLGANEQATNTFEPMLVRWSGQGDNTDWTASATNQAGEQPLSEGSYLIAGAAYRGGALLWSDKGLYSMYYLPGDLLVFGFQLLGTECGLISPNAFAVIDSKAFWISPSGAFYTYQGGAVQPMVCPVRRYFNDYLATVQDWNVYAFTNAEYQEVWWLYPDSRDGVECSRYIMYNYEENWWSVGTFDRTAWEDQTVFPAPIATSSVGKLYFQERPQCTADGGAYTSYATSGFLDLADGTEYLYINRIIPDFYMANANVRVQMTVSTLTEPGATQVDHGPYLVTPTTAYLTFRARGRQASVNITSVQPGDRWRLGAVRVDQAPDGRR